MESIPQIQNGGRGVMSLLPFYHNLFSLLSLKQTHTIMKTFAYGSPYTESESAFFVNEIESEKSWQTYIGNHTGIVTAGNSPVYVGGYQYSDSEPVIIEPHQKAKIKRTRKGNPSLFTEISVEFIGSEQKTDHDYLIRHGEKIVLNDPSVDKEWILKGWELLDSMDSWSLYRKQENEDVFLRSDIIYGSCLLAKIVTSA